MAVVPLSISLCTDQTPFPVPPSLTRFWQTLLYFLLLWDQPYLHIPVRACCMVSLCLIYFPFCDVLTKRMLRANSPHEVILELGMRLNVVNYVPTSSVKSDIPGPQNQVFSFFPSVSYFSHLRVNVLVSSLKIKSSF